MISLKKKVELEEISAASMSDMAFLLLVFFMVTAVFFVKEGLNIQLPRKNARPSEILREHVFEITVSGNTVSMKNKLIGEKKYSDLKEFRKELYALEIPGLPEKLALIATTGDTKYGNMLDVLSSVQLKGFKKVSVKRKK
ncbi:MAG: biopolymer transporter ExbD [Leptospiraceae bacterium]|nr:biopolymer transporter ExbD [Leptospiraceae bacterium]MCP5510943.1 biopolymer transporter ExbD [Leptospiraceae bacterium]